MKGIDKNILQIWLINSKLTLKVIEEYSQENKMSPNLENFNVRFNITRKICEGIKNETPN